MTLLFFLDRDGCLIVDQHYLQDPNKIVLIPGVLETLKYLQEKRAELYLVSNQSGVGRGIISISAFQAVQKRFEEILFKQGIFFQGFFYCLHDPKENCVCRKPSLGILPQMLQDRIKSDQSVKNKNQVKTYVVGDKMSDLELAKNMGATPVLVLTGSGLETKKELEVGRSSIFPVQPMVFDSFANFNI